MDSWRGNATVMDGLIGNFLVCEGNIMPSYRWDLVESYFGPSFV